MMTKDELKKVIMAMKLRAEKEPVCRVRWDSKKKQLISNGNRPYHPILDGLSSSLKIIIGDYPQSVQSQIKSEQKAFLEMAKQIIS